MSSPPSLSIIFVALIHRWIILGIVLAVGILFGLLALKLVRPITIISTVLPRTFSFQINPQALFGSGLFISGISLFPFIAKTGVSVDALKSAFSSGSLPPFSIRFSSSSFTVFVHLSVTGSHILSLLCTLSLLLVASLSSSASLPRIFSTNEREFSTFPSSRVVLSFVSAFCFSFIIISVPSRAARKKVTPFLVQTMADFSKLELPLQK